MSPGALARGHDSSARLAPPRTSRREIACADGPANCPGLLDLKRVLRRVHRVQGRSVDQPGMGVCLVTMLEMAWQHRDHRVR